MRNDVFGLINSVCPFDYGYDSRAEAVGTKGVLFIGSLYEYNVITRTRKEQIVTPQAMSWKKRFYDSYIAEDKHFIDCIINSSKPKVTGEDGKKAVIAVISANKSVIEGQVVDF